MVLPETSLREAIADNAPKYLSWLTEACSIQSLAGQPDELDRMATWVEDKMRSLGAATRRVADGGAPEAVLGVFGSGEPMILVYDHYDVQPVDPLDLWDSKPFEPEVRDGRIYARGAADNKGDLVARLAGLEVYREVHGDLPLTLKFFVEGEEETGSRSFEGITKRHGDQLAADGCVWEGNGIDHAGRPSFVFGVKGLAYVELTYEGLEDDQHSSVAVYAPSPVWRMLEALSTLRDDDGRVLIDGFYADVVEPNADDEKMLAELDFDEDAERARLGIDRFVAGATGVDLRRRMFFSPTCNIAGIVAGFTIPGTSKTVLPKDVLVKLDMRLVPDQDPDDVVDKLRRHLDVRGFSDIEIHKHSMQEPVRSPVDSLIGRATVEAARVTFDEEPALAPMMLGTGPMSLIAKGLGIPTVSPGGVCRPDSNIHAPNENCRIEDFLKVVEYTAAWVDAAGRTER